MLSKTALEVILICDLILKLYSTVSLKFVSKIPMSSNVELNLIPTTSFDVINPQFIA
jgi:hypothetical protein